MSETSIYKLNSKEISSKLAARVKHGDIDTFKLIFTTFWNPLLNFSHNIVGDLSLAENIVQDTFLYVWENRNTIDLSKNFKTYLFTITRNKSLNIQKSHFQSKRSAEDQLLSIENQEKVDVTYENGEAVKKVMDSIEKLPEKSKEIFKMSRFDNLTYNEISEILGISVKTVETQMSRTLKKLKNLLSHLITFFIFLIKL